MNETARATLNWGLGLLAAGLSIIPVNTSGDPARLKKPHFHALHGTGHSRQEWREALNKHVNVPTWGEFQTTRATEEDITAWVCQYRVTGFAVVTGAISNLIGLDFDLAGLPHLARLGFAPHVLTPSGGAHVYVKHPAFRVKTMKASGMKDEALRLPTGVDVRGDGGYIVLPGTVLEGRGAYVRTAEKAFLRVDDIPLSYLDGARNCELRRVLGLTAPEAQHSAARVQTPSFGGRRASVRFMLERAGQLAWQGKGRNEAGFWFAAQMRDNGYGAGETLACYDALHSGFPSADSHGVVSPYRLEEFAASVYSAYSQPPRDAYTERAS